MSKQWDSGLNISDSVKIVIPAKIKQVCDSIQSQHSGKEFSILVKGELYGTTLYLREDYIIPEQEVGGGTVDYEEDISKYQEAGYNVVIHSHPMNMKAFSQSDHETINSHFKASVLYCQGEFPSASFSIQLNENGKLVLDCETKVREPKPIEIDTDNIEEKETDYSGYGKDLDYYSNNEDEESDEGLDEATRGWLKSKGVDIDKYRRDREIYKRQHRDKKSKEQKKRDQIDREALYGFGSY